MLNQTLHPIDLVGFAKSECDCAKSTLLTSSVFKATRTVIVAFVVSGLERSDRFWRAPNGRFREVYVAIDLRVHHIQRQKWSLDFASARSAKILKPSL